MCLAAGMGPALYFDVRSLQRIKHPISQSDIQEMHRVHRFISCAYVGLWVSGVALIWARTNFDTAAFSPKLWSKLIVVSVLTANAVALSAFVIPAMTRFIGNRIVDLPVRLLVPMTISAGVSLSCWMLALVLGSSSVLKTAGWNVLLPIGGVGASVCVLGVLFVTFGMRAMVRRSATSGADTPTPNR